ncbi:MAG: flavin reductase family protein [Planktomarina sp.]
MDGAFDTRAFRNALGGFPTGVCVVTTATPDGQRVGITANSFASVSLDPPLVLWSPAKSSRRHEVYVEAKHFAIHILGKEQGDIANGFVREANAFKDLDVANNVHGVPLIEGCVARFECLTDALHDAGDHTLIIGAVQNFSTNDVDPLAFVKGRYAGLA